MTRGRRSFCTILAILATQVAAAVAAPPRYVSSRDIALEYQPTNAAAVATAYVWVSADAGRTWQPADVVREGERTVHYAAPSDGKYDFYIVLRNAAGASAPDPQPGSTPDITVVVDTTPPLFQVHAAAVEPDDNGRPAVVMQATLVEENLSETAVRVFYRTAPGEWLDGGPAQVGSGRIVWSPPASVSAVIDLRAIAADRAGNRTSSDAHGVRIRPSAPPTAEQTATSQPASFAPTSRTSPVEPPKVAPVAPVAALSNSPTSAPAPLSPTDALDLENLRTLAARFMREGRHSLAAARLQDAVALSPNDPDLQAALGDALYRTGRYDDAEARFQSALATLPNHVPAIEGLALVAATQKRYSQAREQMLHLQQLQPDSGSVWLRSGDIEHRLGNTTQAIAAWQRVLKTADVDRELREKAQRRLEYFAPGRTTPDQPSTAGDQWQSPPKLRPSSSSTEMMSTKSRPR